MHSAHTFTELASQVCEEIRTSLEYGTAWLYLVDETGENIRLVAVSGELDGTVAPELTIPIDADPFINAVLRSDRPTVIEDAQIDPSVNRAVVEELGTRTLISAPMSLVDRPVGLLGAGTFGDEGVRLPTPEQLEYLVSIGQQVVVASARIAIQESKDRHAKERDELNRQMAQRQRLESLGSLAGGIAHDFNNLLTVIYGSATMLRSSVSGRGASDLDVIEEAVSKAADMTKRLLSMSREQPIELHLLDVNSTLRTLIEMLRRVVPANVTVDFVDGKHLSPVLGDPGELEQVFMNLALNSFDAMGAGGRLTIESELVVVNGEYVRAHPWAKPGRYVLVSVSDTGSGMDRETQSHIFEPFFTTKGEKGTGLGLAVSYATVRRHQGMLQAYSEVGVGTTFKVYLPVAQRSAVEVGPKLSGAVTGGVESILLAEDQPEIRETLAQILRQNGYSVRAVANGVEAVAAAKEQDYGLVILDAVMPLMGGREAYEQIRDHAPDLPVLFTSGYGPEELKTRFLQGMRVTVVPKPFDPDTMLRAIRFLLDALDPVPPG
ncbi:MAG: signal transduction histidine kinase [Polyangiales bacterium]